MKTVAILGASEKEGRYSRTAQEILMEKGYNVVPISLKGGNILGLESYKSIAEYPAKIDTLTIYVSPKNMEQDVEAIIRSDIRRVIFNPGTESNEIEQRFRESGKEVVKACTIVMLKTDQFER